LLDLDGMSLYEESPGLDGPDYVTLVIEWDEDADVPTMVSAKKLQPPSETGRKIATVVGAAVAIALAMWGIRRLRAAL
jgi:hypothetical protein